MEAAHKHNLRAIMAMEETEFDRWVATLSEEKLSYVEWLIESAYEVLDEALLQQSGLQEAKEILTQVK